MPQPLPAPFGRLDKALMVLTGLALLAWLAVPESAARRLLLLAGRGLGTAVRLARWRGAATAAEPLLLVLHLGYAWLALALDAAGPWQLWGFCRARLRCMRLTAGAFGTMTLAVMTRAALGHTGRALTADGWTVAIYAMVNLGACARAGRILACQQAYLPSSSLAGLPGAAPSCLRAALWADPARAPARAPRAGPGGLVAREHACLR